jgi:acyl-CoA synthetase (AMP-forming)/AMP-acid ligase II
MQICQCQHTAAAELVVVALLYPPPADLNLRAKLCALALQKLGIKPGDVVGTLAWNTTR